MSVPYLSDEWLAEADGLLRAVDVPDEVRSVRFAIETVVLGGPDGDRSYVISFGPDGAALSVGSDGDAGADVRLTQSWATAVAVAQGGRSAQAAFLAADIQVGGNTATLIAHAGLVAAVGDALGPLRDRTAFPAAR